MAKKKEIKLTRTAGETVESGDVNFSYNDVLIGSLSDSGSAVLKTENTVVKHDIEVEYTKPAAPSLGNTLNVTNNSSTIQNVDGSIIYNNVYNYFRVSSNESQTARIYCVYEDNYIVHLNVIVNADTLNVTVNNTALTYTPSSRGGYYKYSSTPSSDPIYGETYNVVISDKE